MDKNNDKDSQDEIFDLFLKWKDTPKNEKARFAITLKEKISDTIPESYRIKIEECNMRYFVLLTDSDFINCKTQPFTCVYEFCQYLENFHQKDDDWCDTLLPHCLPGSNRQQWIAYNLYRFKFTWKQVCYRLMQKYDSPSRRSKIGTTLKETKFDSSQSIEKFNQIFNTHIDELFYDEQTAIQIYKTIIPSKYASMLSSTIIIDEGTSFICTLADIQQRITCIVNATDKDFICYTGISHTIYSTESESSICCQDQHSLSNCPDTFVLRWPKNDLRNKRNEVGKKPEPISFLPKTVKAEIMHAPSVVVPPIITSGVPSSKLPSNLTPVLPSAPSSFSQSPRSSTTKPNSTPISSPVPSIYRPVVSQNNVALKRQSSPPSRTGDGFPPTMKRSKNTTKCRSCGHDLTYGHNNICPERGGHTIPRTK